jgi:hypothetical protein
MACPIVLVVASVDKDHPILLPAWVAKELDHHVAVSQLQALFLETRGQEFLG